MHLADTCIAPGIAAVELYNLITVIQDSGIGFSGIVVAIILLFFILLLLGLIGLDRIGKLLAGEHGLEN